MPLLIGTSGWHYASWIGPFYPPKVPKTRLLALYAERFGATEINMSFYGLPSEAALAAWRDGTPDGFVFAWKAHRAITHYKRLLNAEDSIARVFGRMAGLGPKSGPVLFQLPPRFRADRERLAGFLRGLPAGYRYGFEFRDPSWYETPILTLLEGEGVSLCLSDHVHAPAPILANAPLVYVRLHGPSGRYHGSYADEALAEWAARIRVWLQEGREVCCFFDNDIKAAAPADAGRLGALLAGPRPACHLV